MNRRKFIASTAALGALPILGKAAEPLTQNVSSEAWHPFHHRHLVDQLHNHYINYLEGITWDFNTAKGDTVKEKLNSLNAMIEATKFLLDNTLVKRPSDRITFISSPFSAISSPEITGMLSCCDTSEFNKFYPKYKEYDEGLFEVGGYEIDCVTYYQDEKLPSDHKCIVVRADIEKNPTAPFNTNHYRKIVVENFIL